MACTTSTRCLSSSLQTPAAARSALRGVRQPSSRRSRSLQPVRAMQSGKNDGGILSGVENMLTKYDFLSTGLGALSVTTYCVVYKHQDPMTALQITATSVVLGLVLNEVLFNEEK